MSRLLLCFALMAAGLTAENADKKSAFDKPTFEAYVRHLKVWGPQIKVDIADPKPSEMPGFSLVNVHASAGAASADFQYYVSKDGQKVVDGTLYDIAQNPYKTQLDKLKIDLQPSFGTPGAPVVLVEFSDFECPMCKEEAKMLRDNLLSTYPKQVRFYFEEFPLDQIHPWARAAAIAGRCVFRQNANAFWDFHDWIFAHQEEVNAGNLKDKVLEFAKGKELDPLQLTRCMDNKETEAEIAKSQALGKDVGVGATPTLYVNGRPLVGRIDWPSLRNIIDYEIDYQKTAHNAGEDCGCEVALPAPKLTPPTVFAQEQAPPKYSCTQSTHPGSAIGSAIEGGGGSEIGLFDESTRSRVGKFQFAGKLWFFDGGESTEVGEGTRVLDFSLGDYHPDPASLRLCASGKYFILSSESRRFRIQFPSAAFTAFILEIK